MVILDGLIFLFKSYLKYDLNRNIIKKTFPNGDIYKYEYDKNNNLIKIIFPNKTIEEYQYNNRNNITKIIFPNGNIKEYTFKYDSLDRLIQINDCHIEYL